MRAFHCIFTRYSSYNHSNNTISRRHFDHGCWLSLHDPVCILNFWLVLILILGNVKCNKRPFLHNENFLFRFCFTFLKLTMMIWSMPIKQWFFVIQFVIAQKILAPDKIEWGPPDGCKVFFFMFFVYYIDFRYCEFKSICSFRIEIYTRWTISSLSMFRIWMFIEHLSTCRSPVSSHSWTLSVSYIIIQERERERNMSST